MKIKSIKLFLAVISITLLAACEKNTLEPSVTEPPKIYFEAQFDGVLKSYKAGEQTYQANSYHRLDNHQNLLIYTFAIEDYLNPSISYVEISINNYLAPFINKDYDIDYTIKPGSYKFENQNPTPQNPKHLSEVSINWYNDLKEKYSTFNINQKYSQFYIVSVKDTVFKRTNGNVKLKKAVIFFDCVLKNNNPVFNDTIRLKQGRAVAIF